MTVPVVRQTAPWPRRNEAPADYATKADAVGATLPNTVEDINASAVFVNNRANAADASAIVAGQKAVEAANSATLAGQKAGEAGSSATLAGQKAAEASGSAAVAADRLAQFNDRYLGAKAADPSTDNDGDALVVGTLYFNTTLSGMRIWNGSVWTTAAGVITPDFSVVREVKVADEGQTLFNLTNSYAVGRNTLMVYLNGARLLATDYAETSSSSVTLTSGCAAGDELLFEIGVVAAGGTTAAGNVSFNPGAGLTSTNVQDAMVEVGANVQVALAAAEAKVPSLAQLHAIALSI